MLYMSEQTIKSWENEFVPEKDLFFFETLDEVIELMPIEVLVMPKTEFFSHNAYSTIDYINANWYWNISKTVNFVCILPPEIFPTIPDEKKQKILSIQQQTGRGLIFEYQEIEPVLEKYSDQKPYSFVLNGAEYFAFQRDQWTKLSSAFKREILAVLSREYIDDVYELTEDELLNLQNNHPQLLSLINRFPERGGGNCFAAVLASITSDEALSGWIAREWVAQETLLTALEQRKYQKTTQGLDTLESKDVMLWRNEQGIIIHGAFVLGDGLVFNKNGQQFFNPWQVLKLEVLLKNWGDSKLEVWRRITFWSPAYG